MEHSLDHFKLSAELWSVLIVQNPRTAAQQESYELARKLQLADVTLIGPEEKILGYDPLEDTFFDTGEISTEISKTELPFADPVLPAKYLLWSAVLFLVLRLAAGMLLECYGSEPIRALNRQLLGYGQSNSLLLPMQDANQKPR